ncbi:WD repeat-containing protein 26, partial [Dissophora globulifera]
TRRVSQAYLSPLSPDLSEPSNSTGSYFGTVPEGYEYKPGMPETTAPGLLPSPRALDHDMSMSTSPSPSCTYCSGMRSNSISSVSTQDDIKSAVAGHSSSSGAASTIGSFNTGLGLQLPNRNSQYFDNNRLAVLKEYVPSEVRLRLNYHLDECWTILFSPSGQYMASTGLDDAVVLWQDITTLEPKVYKTFQFHRTIKHVEWCPNSRYLIVNFGRDPRRDPQSALYRAETYIVDVTNLTGELQEEFDMGCRIRKLMMYPGKDIAVVSTIELKYEAVTLGTMERRFLASVEDMPSSSSVSKDGRYFTASLYSDESMCRPAQILIFDFQTGKMVKSLSADSYLNESFNIVPVFCGPNNEILLAGSENGKLHYWDIETGELIAVLVEHSKHSGCCTFFPSMPGFMASASDDNTVIIWVTKDLSRELQDEDEKWIERKRAELALPAINIKKGW